MALTDFATYFDPTYQEILSKTLVGKKIANTRFQSNLKYGDTVTRFALDLSAVQVRTISNLTDRTVDPITDSEQNLTINFVKGTTFPLANLEKIQAGPLNPGEVAGREVALKVATALDAFILAETVNAFAVFDTGNLTTMTASGTPITLNSTTVPQMVTRTEAKLRSNNVAMTDLCWVLDPYAISDIAQYPIGKDITAENTTFKNGLKGNIYGAEVYLSNNLTGEATLVYTGNHVNAETVTINGVVFTGVTTIGATAGNFLVSASDSTTGITNLAALLNAPGTTNANQVALSAANQATINALNITATATSTTVLTIVAKGSGRLTLAETQTNATWATNFIHAYYGMKGGIDVVIQEEVDMVMLQEPKQRTVNILCDIVAGIKTFTDGSQKFLDVKIAA